MEPWKQAPWDPTLLLPKLWAEDTIETSERGPWRHVHCDSPETAAMVLRAINVEQFPLRYVVAAPPLAPDAVRRRHAWACVDGVGQWLVGNDPNPFPRIRLFSAHRKDKKA